MGYLSDEGLLLRLFWTHIWYLTFSNWEHLWWSKALGQVYYYRIQVSWITIKPARTDNYWPSHWLACPIYCKAAAPWPTFLQHDWSKTEMGWSWYQKRENSKCSVQHQTGSQSADFGCTQGGCRLRRDSSPLPPTLQLQVLVLVFEVLFPAHRSWSFCLPYLKWSLCLVLP